MRGFSPTGDSATRRLAEPGSGSPRRVAVAYSGGRDSTALLHVTLRVAEVLGLEVLALHVHHGLSRHADAWLSHCRERCRRWARTGRPVIFAAERVIEAPARAESVEAWARRVRYAALRRLALVHGCDIVLLAQHRRDQAETFLLQALRGAGPAGWAGMRRVTHRDGVTWARPWLDVPHAAIDSYVKRHRLLHVEDDSNDDLRYARNRLRAKAWPALIDAFPDAELTLANAASRAHDAAAALAELAVLDLAIAAPAGDLDIARWSDLSAARRANALRAWLQRETGSAPGTLVERLLRELPGCFSARWPLGTGELQCHRGRLKKGPSLAAAQAALGAVVLSIREPGIYRVPSWQGSLRVASVTHGGVPLARLALVELRRRAGRERFQSGTGRPARALKKQYQAAGLAAWQREGPLVYSGDALVFVPGLGIDARVRALGGERQVTLDWLDEAAGNSHEHVAPDVLATGSPNDPVEVGR